MLELDGGASRSDRMGRTAIIQRILPQDLIATVMNFSFSLIETIELSGLS
jgi:hypothetical protein